MEEGKIIEAVMISICLLLMFALGYLINWSASDAYFDGRSRKWERYLIAVTLFIPGLAAVIVGALAMWEHAKDIIRG